MPPRPPTQPSNTDAVVIMFPNWEIDLGYLETYIAPVEPFGKVEATIYSSYLG